MSASQIPARQPIGDSFEGLLLRVGESYILALEPLAGTEHVATGSWIIRYGVVYLGKPQYSIVPGLLALDYGEFLTGEDAWNFLLHRSNLYPRADVLGYRNDGLDDMIVVKQLDLMQAFHILLYADELATTPIAQISAVIAPELAILPERIAQYAPTYPEINAWKKDIS